MKERHVVWLFAICFVFIFGGCAVSMLDKGVKAATKALDQAVKNDPK